MESSGSHFQPSSDLQHQQNLQQIVEGKEQLIKSMVRVPSQNENRNTIMSLQKRIRQLEGKLSRFEQREVQHPKKKKKIRRKAKQVPKLYQCSFSNCEKQYGSEASLRNHKKIKHGMRLFRATKYKMQRRPPPEEVKEQQRT